MSDQDATAVLEAITVLNAAKRSTNLSQVARRTGLSRDRVLAAGRALSRQYLVRDVGPGAAYNWRIIKESK